MKKNYKLIAFASLMIVSSAQSFAQCGGSRFHDYVFPTPPTATSNIVYGHNLTASGIDTVLKLDVYQPVGDVSTSRPLVIAIHGGSFVGGSKTGGDVVPFCKDLARLGYVTASMEYRLGMTNFPFGSHTVDSTDAAAELMRAVQDARAAVRFFRKDARVGGNTYKIDTNNIFLLGVSAGGLTALHLAYLDQMSEFPNYIDTTGVTSGSVTGEPGLHGGLEGLSGNPGYPSTVKAIVNICGALGDTLWMHPGDVPVLSFHGTADGTVPYGYATIAVLGIPLLKVCGSSVVAKRADHIGIPNCMETWLGADHVPESGTSASNLRYYDSCITITRTWLEHFTCATAQNCSYTATPIVMGVDELANNMDYSIYPNPANSHAIIDLAAFNGKTVNIELYDALGRKVVNTENMKTDRFLLNKNNLPAGMYFINVISEGKIYSKKIIFE